MAKTRRKPEEIAPVASQPESVELNHREVYDYLISKGVGDVHAKGILANIAADERLQPWAVSPEGADGELSFGFFQSQLQKKQDDFLAFLREENAGWKHYWQAPIDFTLKAQDGKAYLDKTFSSPDAASRWFTEKLEKAEPWLKRVENKGIIEYRVAKTAEVKGHEKDTAWLEENGYVRNADYRVQQHLEQFLPFTPAKATKRQRTTDPAAENIQPYISKLDALLVKLQPFIQTKT